SEFHESFCKSLSAYTSVSQHTAARFDRAPRADRSPVDNGLQYKPPRRERRCSPCRILAKIRFPEHSCDRVFRTNPSASRNEDRLSSPCEADRVVRRWILQWRSCFVGHSDIIPDCFVVLQLGAQ